MGTTSSDSSQPTSGTSSTGQAPASFRATSEETISDVAVSEYLTEIRDQDVSLAEIRDELLSRINARYEIENVARNAAHSSSPKLTKLRVLDEYTVVRVLLARYRIAAISLSESSGDDDMTVLGMYEDFGDDEGLYTMSTSRMMRLVSELRPSISAAAVDSLLIRLRAHAPVLRRTNDPELIPVRNGIFDHAAQELRPFSPDYVFLTKLSADWEANPALPVIQNPDGTQWDVDSWIEELSDDEGVPQLLWEIISATLRPDVRWNKAAFFYSTRGNNGKGTLCHLLRQLTGDRGSASIPIANFGKPFALTELIHARAIITDENSVGAFAKDLGDFKSVVTGDTFTLDRKYRDPVSVRFSGMVIQCVNDFPKSRDKSASYTRRQLFVPFRKWFGGEGVERGYIKSDYLTRPEVLRYVMHKALAMTHTEFSNPEVCQELLARFQRENNPVRDFWLEFEDQFAWDLLPTAFLYDLFVAWFRQTHPSGQPTHRNEFASSLVEMLASDEHWEFTDPQKKHRPGSKLDAPEQLIEDYDLVKRWGNSSYSGNDASRKLIPRPLKTNYIGVVRKQPIPQGAVAVGSRAPEGDVAEDAGESVD